jgi:hypothetical protein
MIIIKNHLRVYEIVIQLLTYLKENWEIGYIPNFEKIEYDFDIENEYTKEWFNQAIFHLINRGLIGIEFNINGIIRITRGEIAILKKYNFYDFHYPTIVK